MRTGNGICCPSAPAVGKVRKRCIERVSRFFLPAQGWRSFCALFSRCCLSISKPAFIWAALRSHRPLRRCSSSRGRGCFGSGWREQDESAAFLKGNRWLECTAALLGAVLLADSVSGLLRVLAISPDAQLINQMPRLLQLLEHLLGAASGGVFLCLAIVLLSGAARSGIQGMLALIPVLWQTLNMVDRFFGFRQVSTASDQTLEVLFLVSATLFLLAHTRCVANIPLSRRACVTRGFLTALFGFPARGRPARGGGSARRCRNGSASAPPRGDLRRFPLCAACSLSLVLSAGRGEESR